MAASTPEDINQRLYGFDRRLNEITDMVYQLHNGSCADGEQGNLFKVIPFRPDGQEVMPEQLHLPALTTATATRELDQRQLASYLNGYGIPYAEDLSEAQKKRLLYLHIGGTMPLRWYD
ncbi:hypothetical protein PAXINDRAFT_103969 [Paxillus involutus ATCC 200175]|uniref:Mug135-like C-terminal domain-containing protein n=1 Tax=Paxillus involutus ATCC 200175 TaxID=664439 RepID=A0A0C9SLS3_PAXIN|nr:hypothetical protein PAXINDRAFT_103969 [Paxillus involutus ATCC 200175]